MLGTFRNIRRLIPNTIVTKNAWNCFRIRTFARLFNDSVFVWIRRDISDAAYSDLKSRRFRGSPYVWNSAPTHNYEEICKRPYWEQVVEQQYEYNRIVELDLTRFCSGRHVEIWYENLCDDMQEGMHKIETLLLDNNIEYDFKNVNKYAVPRRNSYKSIDDDRIRIDNYINNNMDRFESYVCN
jgi:hypothetical protein